MKSPRLRGTFLLLVSTLLAASTPGLASAEIYSGKATRVGDVPPVGSNGDSIVGMSARFTPVAPIDLSTAKLTLTSILREPGVGGADELVQGTAGAALVPLTLSPRRGARATSAVYVTEGRVRPAVRVALRRLRDGSYQLNLKVNRATIPVGPALCDGTPSTTTLKTALSFDTVPPITHTFTQPWLCETGRLRVVRPPAPTPVPGTPVANIRVEQITRQTGEPSLVRLDGSSSSDSDGTIASYTFSVINRANSAVVFGPSTVATATTETTLPPGDYEATLTVTDNDAKTSKQASRGFRIH